MVINESGLGDAGTLVDEQYEDAPKTYWKIDDDKKWIYPISLVIDLGSEYNISQIKYFDANGRGNLEVSGGEPFHWTLYFTDPLNQYNSWTSQTLRFQTRFVRFVFQNSEARINELMIFGTSVKKALPPIISKAESGSPFPIDQFIGTNSFIDVPFDKITPVSFIREYHSWDWMEGDRNPYEGYPKNKNQFNPTIAGGGWNFDSYYEKLKKGGYTVSPVLMGNVLWQVNNEVAKLQCKPISKNGISNTENPVAYVAHADHLYQYAARYGNQKLDSKFLKLATGQEAKSGLGFIEYYENWNEPNNWWSGRAAYFTPYEYAAMSSADYDGHCKTMGNTVGIKNADPNSKLIMGGLASLNLDYLKAIQFWFENNRADGKFPFYAINFHHYSNNAKEEGGNSTVGISPEEDMLFEKVSIINNYRKKYLPNTQLWITEFGYDDFEKGRQIAPAIGMTTSEETQALWVLRSYLALAAAGVDRAAQFMIRNGDGANSETYNQCGLTTSKENGYKLKIAWYYVHQMKRILTNTKYFGQQKSGDILIYKFKDTSNNSFVYAVWSGTSKNAILSTFSLKISSNIRDVKFIEMSANSISSIERKLEIKNNVVQFPISEKPVFLKLSE